MLKGVSSIERMIDALYASVANEDWSSEFLAEVCAATKSDSGAVVVTDLTSRTDRLPSFHGASDASALAYEALYSSMNPWRQAAVRPGKAGDVVIADDVVDLPTLRRTEFWRKFLHPMDVDHAAGIVGLSNVSSAVSLTLLRSARSGRFDRNEELVLKRLGPHWANACAIRSRLSILHSCSRGLESALDQVATAVMTLGTDGTVVRENAAASAMFSRGTFLRLKEGRIRTADADSDTRFKKALLRASVASAGSVTPAAKFLTLSDASRRHVAIAAIHALRSSSDGDAATAILFVSEPSELQHPELGGAMVELYGLTKAEVALCQALLTELDLGEAGQAVGLRRSTSRSRLKTIFEKTDTKSQPALMMLLTRLRSLIA
jgi:DNA-binding CsgD family transcriptional regulator